MLEKGNMQTFLSFILLNMASQYLPTKIHSITVDFLEGVPTIALLTNNPNDWNVQFNVPLTIRRLDDTTRHNQPKAAFILDLRYQTLSSNQLKPLTRTASTRYILITSKENMETTSKSLHQIGLCHVLLVTIESNDVNISYPYDPCSGIGTDVTHGHNCTANVSFLHFPPMIIFTRGVLEGTEGKTVEAITQSMDIKINYINREAFWGHFEPPSGLEGDISTRRSLIAIGALYWHWWRFEYSETLVGCTTIDAQYAVPTGAGPTSPTWFIILISELTPLVWLCVFLSYILLIGAAMIIERNPEHNNYWPFHTLALVLGTSQKHIIHRKPLLIAVILYGFLLTTFYQSIMSSKLTVPTKIPEITTLKEVTESGLELIGPRNGNNLVRGIASKNAVLRKLNATIKDDAVPGREAMLEIATKRKKAYLRHGPVSYYEAQMDPRSADRIHIVEEPVQTFMPVMLVRKHDCLFHQIHMQYHRLCDCGLIGKWESDGLSKRPLAPDEGPKRLTLEHIKGFFILLGIGWSASLLAFLGELFITRFSQRQRLFTHLRNAIAQN